MSKIKLLTILCSLFTFLFHNGYTQYILSDNDVIIKHGIITKCISYTEPNIIIPPYLNGQEVQSIGFRAFSSDFNLLIHTINFPFTLKNIDSEAFESSWVDSVSFGTNLVYINDDSFDKRVELPTNLLLKDKFDTDKSDISINHIDTYQLKDKDVIVNNGEIKYKVKINFKK